LKLTASENLSRSTFTLYSIVQLLLRFTEAKQVFNIVKNGKEKIKRATKRLKSMRNKWKKGYSEKVKDPAIFTKSSVRTISGGLPGSKR